MEIREYITNDVVFFQKTKESFGGLSNMAAGYSVFINGVIIPTVEHLYQACKFPLFPDIQEQILAEASPITAKMVSRKYGSFVRQDWDIIRIKVMRWVLSVKLSQNWNTFSELLLKTGDKPIVELSHKDKIWGAVKSGDGLIGVNALGRLLMELRDKYAKIGDHQLCIPPPSIVGFMLYGHEIGNICDDAARQEFSQYKEELEHC